MKCSFFVENLVPKNHYIIEKTFVTLCNIVYTLCYIM
jgi:hypothetical protein